MATFLELCAKILTEDNMGVNTNTTQQPNQPSNTAQKPAVPSQTPSQTNNQQQNQTPNQNQQKPAPIKVEDVLKNDISNHPMAKDPNIQKALQQIVDTYNKTLTNPTNAANK